MYKKCWYVKIEKCVRFELLRVLSFECISEDFISTLAEKFVFMAFTTNGVYAYFQRFYFSLVYLGAVFLSRIQVFVSFDIAQHRFEFSQFIEISSEI